MEEITSRIESYNQALH